MNACASMLMGKESVELSEGILQYKQEHGPLLDMLNSLLQLSEDLKKSPAKVPLLERLVQEVESFFHKLEDHSSREEEILFPMIEAYMGKQGPIAVMEYEHSKAKEYIESFLGKASFVHNMKNDEMDAQANLIISAYYTLVDHFAKEENVLFPMAETLLSEEEKEQLLRRESIAWNQKTDERKINGLL